MSRTQRIKSSTGLYHIMLRGMDRRIIFTDDMDRYIFLRRVAIAKEKSNFKLYAYCLMDNHVHMLIKEQDEPLELIFKRIGVSYVSYYNKKYELYGHLFQDRFRSEAIESDAYFLDVLRYICHNPIKAGLCNSIFDYKWLECSRIRQVTKLIDDIGEYVSLPRKEMLDFVKGECFEPHLDDKAPVRLNDRDAISVLISKTGYENPNDLCRLDDNQLQTVLITCLKAGIAARQFSRITGISKHRIEDIKKRR